MPQKGCKKLGEKEEEEEQKMIRGEYWIKDGQVDFADGDIGDFNHEAIAIQHFANKHIDEIINLAHDLDVDLEDFRRNEEYPAGDAEEVRNKIISAVENKEIEWVLPDGVDASDSVDEYIQKTLKIDDDEFSCIFGNCDARSMVMEKEGWIAVRNDNVEMFGYNDEKRKEIVDGIEDILSQEGLEEEADENIELYLYDHKTQRSWDATLADLKSSGARAIALPNTTYNKPLFIPPDRSGPMGSQSPKTLDAQTRSSLSTSESLNFKDWLMRESIFDLEKERGLKGWFDRNGGKGWVDCRASRKGKIVPCGRKKAGRGAERKYPACRPTLGACNKKGVRRKKSKKIISWD